MHEIQSQSQTTPVIKTLVQFIWNQCT